MNYYISNLLFKKAAELISRNSSQYPCAHQYNEEKNVREQEGIIFTVKLDKEKDFLSWTTHALNH